MLIFEFDGVCLAVPFAVKLSCNFSYTGSVTHLQALMTFLLHVASDIRRIL